MPKIKPVSRLSNKSYEGRLNKNSYEGRQGAVRKLKTPSVETWKNQYPDRVYTIRSETDEFSCVCPKTGLPDFANLVLEYQPDKVCLELKSFKLYLVFFRNIGIFHEHVINKIFDDLLLVLKPRQMFIAMTFKSRGGIITIVKREFCR